MAREAIVGSYWFPKAGFDNPTDGGFILLRKGLSLALYHVGWDLEPSSEAPSDITVETLRGSGHYDEWHLHSWTRTALQAEWVCACGKVHSNLAGPTKATDTSWDQAKARHDEAIKRFSAAAPDERTLSDDRLSASMQEAFAGVEALQKQMKARTREGDALLERVQVLEKQCKNLLRVVQELETAVPVTLGNTITDEARQVRLERHAGRILAEIAPVIILQRGNRMTPREIAALSVTLAEELLHSLEDPLLPTQKKSARAAARR